MSMDDVFAVILSVVSGVAIIAFILPRRSGRRSWSRVTAERLASELLQDWADKDFSILCQQAAPQDEITTVEGITYTQKVKVTWPGTADPDSVDVNVIVLWASNGDNVLELNTSVSRLTGVRNERQPADG